MFIKKVAKLRFQVSQLQFNKLIHSLETPNQTLLLQQQQQQQQQKKKKKKKRRIRRDYYATL